GTLEIPTYDAPDEADVRDGVVYDDATGTPTEGTAAIPAAADVRAGVAVDDTVGTAAIPGAADVRAGVAVDGTVGTLEVTGSADTHDHSVTISGHQVSIS
ncbi:MAG: hypothetical protein GX591_20505, partial [Planctomycetes bacterium]|nr:hypothetical protein [Planctomycetota bacterium]